MLQKVVKNPQHIAVLAPSSLLKTQNVILSVNNLLPYAHLELYKKYMLDVQDMYILGY